MKKEITYKSKDNKTAIHATIWIPTIPIRGIVQISHGMIESMFKYEDFARILNQEGYIVCGEDHLGHGKSAIDKQHLGYIAEKHPEDVLLEDAHTLTKIMKKEYPGLPIFMFGFSMGSFITRYYMSKYGDELAGVILMGSTCESTSKLNFGIMYAKMQEYTSGGPFGYSKSLDNMTTGKNNTYFANSSYKLCWVAKDFKAVDKVFRNNPLTDFKFKNNAYSAMFKLMRKNNKRSLLKQIPKSLPILILSGKNDPVTHFGKDVGVLEKIYTKLGITSVRARFYNEARHDLLLEREKDIFINEIVRFVKLHTDPALKPMLPPKVVTKVVSTKTVKANFNMIEEQQPVEEPKVTEPVVVKEPTPEVKEETVQEPKVTEPIQEEVQKPEETGKKKKKKDKKKHNQENIEEVPEVTTSTPEESKEETPKEEEPTPEVKEEPKEEKQPEPTGKKKKKDKNKVQPSINFDDETKKEEPPKEEEKKEEAKDDNIQPSINFDDDTPIKPKKEKKKKKTKEEIENERIEKIQGEDGVFDEISFENYMNEENKK